MLIQQWLLPFYPEWVRLCSSTRWWNRILSKFAHSWKIRQQTSVVPASLYHNFNPTWGKLWNCQNICNQIFAHNRCDTQYKFLSHVVGHKILQHEVSQVLPTEFIVLCGLSKCVASKDADLSDRLRILFSSLCIKSFRFLTNSTAGALERKSQGGWGVWAGCRFTRSHS